mmetsp:Transcript_3405/g.8112  ORF Transcript_3405/g.8112 Transcript_3405/m.8112 type:complete len:356 (+) Transcript_3405:671-1738(+)
MLLALPSRIADRFLLSCCHLLDLFICEELDARSDVLVHRRHLSVLGRLLLHLLLLCPQASGRGRARQATCGARESIGGQVERGCFLGQRHFNRIDFLEVLDVDVWLETHRTVGRERKDAVRVLFGDLRVAARENHGRLVRDGSLIDRNEHRMVDALGPTTRAHLSLSDRLHHLGPRDLGLAAREHHARLDLIDNRRRARAGVPVVFTRLPRRVLLARGPSRRGVELLHQQHRHFAPLDLCRCQRRVRGCRTLRRLRRCGPLEELRRRPVALIQDRTLSRGAERLCAGGRRTSLRGIPHVPALLRLRTARWALARVASKELRRRACARADAARRDAVRHRPPLFCLRTRRSTAGRL